MISSVSPLVKDSSPGVIFTNGRTTIDRRGTGTTVADYAARRAPVDAPRIIPSTEITFHDRRASSRKNAIA